MVDAPASNGFGLMIRNISNALAPTIAGPASRNENRTASSRVSPAHIPAAIEKPLRDPPGKTPPTWLVPTINALHQDNPAAPGSFVQLFGSGNHIRSLPGV